MKNLQFQGISENIKYIFTNRGIITTSDYFEGKSGIIEYSFRNLTIAVDILKEHRELYYKLNKISLQEYSSAPRKFIYELMEVFQPVNQINIIKEWEEKHGSNLILINESEDKLLVESKINDSWTSIKMLLESDWYNPLSWDWKGGAERVGQFAKDTVKGAVDWTKEQGKQLQQKGIVGYVSDKAKSIWSSVKNAVSKAYKCLTNNFAECLFENLRKALFSAVGMGAMTAISFIPGVGQIADVIAFGSLLIWDVYKALSGKYNGGEYQWSWMDIVIDAVCMLLPALGAGLKYALRGVKTAGQFAAAAAKGGIVGKAFNLLKGGLSKIVSLIGKAATWIGEKLGITWLKNFGGKAQSFITKEVQEIVQAGGTTILKAGEKTAATTGKKTVTQKIGAGVQKATQRLDKAEAGVQQFLKDFKFGKPTPVVMKKAGGTVLLTAALCSAMGVPDPWGCRHHVENEKISPEEINKLQQALSSQNTVNKLNQLTDEESQLLFGF
jgi:hypothetical protein